MPLSDPSRPAARFRNAAPILAALMLLATAASPADAQMPRSTTKSSIIAWVRGDASHDGYESVSGWFDYYFAPCVGSSITAQLTLRPEVTAAPIYWYRGTRHVLTSEQASMFDDVKPTRVEMVTSLDATQSKQLTAFEPTTSSCQGWQAVVEPARPLSREGNARGSRERPESPDARQRHVAPTAAEQPARAAVRSGDRPGAA